VRAELDALEEAARELAGPSPGDRAKLSAVRKLIYQKGPWSGHRPFSYDHPNWKNIPAKLLSNYLASRRGQCVSMPILFLILGERLGLDLALATAPSHLFVRYRDESGRVFNLETTSGALPTREEWIRRSFPMTDLALKNGLYRRSLGRREAVAQMASTVNEHLMAQGHYREVSILSQIVLEHWPRDIHALLSLGSAAAHLIEVKFTRRYPSPFLIPPLSRPDYLRLCRLNEEVFRFARELGWEPEE
jgi:regulator of sirC expression with transglutaminase-like and TPR domain